jgi:hypothetical protein
MGRYDKGPYIIQPFMHFQIPIIQNAFWKMNHVCEEKSTDPLIRNKFRSLNPHISHAGICACFFRNLSSRWLKHLSLSSEISFDGGNHRPLHEYSLLTTHSNVHDDTLFCIQTESSSSMACSSHETAFLASGSVKQGDYALSYCPNRAPTWIDSRSWNRQQFEENQSALKKKGVMALLWFSPLMFTSLHLCLIGWLMFTSLHLCLIRCA